MSNQIDILPPDQENPGLLWNQTIYSITLYKIVNQFFFHSLTVRVQGAICALSNASISVLILRNLF
jgi:hypothetical protein